MDARKTGAGPNPDARSSAYIRLAADGAFLPLIRPVPLRSVIGQAAFDAIPPCDGPSSGVGARLSLPLRLLHSDDRLGIKPNAGAASARYLEDVVLSHSDPATGLPVGPRTTRADADYTAEDMLAAVLASVEDDKAEDVVQIDLRGRSDVADYMVICSGRSSRQVAAISEKLADRIKEAFRLTVKMEGKETGDWVLIDTGDVIVHVFRPEVREFYQLEKMWLPGSAHRGA